MQCLDHLDAVTKVRYLKKLSILNLPEYMVSGKTAIEACYWPKLKNLFFPPYPTDPEKAPTQKILLQSFV